MTMHDDEIAIPDDIMRVLVHAQFPQWRAVAGSGGSCPCGGSHRPGR
jgi:hypothetical protein